MPVGKRAKSSQLVTPATMARSGIIRMHQIHLDSDQLRLLSFALGKLSIQDFRDFMGMSTENSWGKVKHLNQLLAITAEEVYEVEK